MRAPSYLDHAYAMRDVLLFGRESAGVPDHVHAAAAVRLRIPMRPGLRSLNVAMACAMATGEALRQTGGFAAERHTPRGSRPPAHLVDRGAGARVDLGAGHGEAVLFVKADGPGVVAVDMQVESRGRDALGGIEQRLGGAAAPCLGRDGELIEIAGARIDGDEADDDRAVPGQGRWPRATRRP